MPSFSHFERGITVFPYGNHPPGQIPNIGAMDWICVPLQFVGWGLLPAVMVLGDRPLEMITSWGWRLHESDWCPYKRNPGELPFCHERTQWEVGHLWTRKTVLTGHHISRCLDLELPGFHQCLLFKPPVCEIIIAAQADENNPPPSIHAVVPSPYTGNQHWLVCVTTNIWQKWWDATSEIRLW